MTPPDSRLTRRAVLASAATLGTAGALARRGTVARFSDTETESGTLSAGTWAQHHAVFTRSGALRSVRDGIAELQHPPSSVNVIGATTLDLGGNFAIPFHDSNGLQYVDGDGTTNALSTGGTSVNNQKSFLATGTWDGSVESVFYANGNQDAIYRVAPADSSPTKIADLGNGAGAVLGPGDVDADGTEELVYIDGSAVVRYLEPGDSTEYKIGGVGSNNNFGAGPPGSFPAYGVRVPIIDGSNDVALMDVDGSKTRLTSNGPAKKTGVSSLDIDLDGELEHVFVHVDDELAYVDDVGGQETIERVTDDTGSKITGIDTKRGVQ